MKKNLIFLFLFCLSALSFAQVKIHVGASRPINSDFIGVNGNLTSFNQPWENDSLIKSFKQLKVSNLRYPAGTLGNTWDWDRGWIDPDVSDSDLIDWVVQNNLKSSKNRYTLENFAIVVRETGVTPVFMLNMLSKDLEHAIRGLRKAKALGMPVKYVELGNELFFNLPLEVRMFPTPEDYGKTCYKWIKRIKDEFPDAQCAVIGTDIKRSERHTNWTNRVLKYATNADAVTFHFYTPSGLFGGRSRSDDIAGKEGIAEEKKTFSNPIEKQNYEIQLLKETEAVNRMMKTAWDAANRYKAMNLHDTVPIWITEFNLRADADAVRGTWANALFVATIYHAFMKSKNIVLSNFHNITGSQFGAILNNRNSFEHVLNQKIQSDAWILSAGGLMTSFFAEAMNGMTSASEIILGTNEGDNYLNFGWLFSNGLQKTAIFVNNTNEAIPIATTEFRGWSYNEIQGNLQSYIRGAESITANSGKLDELHDLKPYSVLLLRGK